MRFTRRVGGVLSIGIGGSLAIAAVVLAGIGTLDGVLTAVPGVTAALGGPGGGGTGGTGGGVGTGGHSVLHPAAYAAGATLLVAGTAAVRDRTIDPRTTLVIPAIGLGLALIGGVLGGTLTAVTGDPVGAGVGGLTPESTFAIAGTAVGTAVAPVVVGALREHTIVLLAGFVVAIAAVAASPTPVLAAAVGLGGGTGAIAVAWRLDPDGWRP
ncbi:hypothetical protein [Halopenitus sp. POP-27]|uniref:hypothetical protein n=1 Tax=Halopenitus sp. POP-27 TaxID=2994425 RepID=UPI002468C351|nr:hypothetical protein [Halopenitus sp. POP-27]